jgi:hypothetical protein
MGGLVVVASKIMFHSPYPNYEVVYKTARITHTHDGSPIVSEGGRLRFVRGVLEVDADNTEALAGIRKSRFYGVDFFEHGVSEKVTPAEPAVDTAVLLRKIAELEARLGDAPTDFNELKARVKALGITASRDWKREDYEKALANHGGAQ